MSLNKELVVLKQTVRWTAIWPLSGGEAENGEGKNVRGREDHQNNGWKRRSEDMKARSPTYETQDRKKEGFGEKKKGHIKGH